MRKALAALSLAILVPAAARPQEEAGSRFTVGLRLGFAMAAGTAFADPASGHGYRLADGFRSQIPIQLEGAYRLNERIALGAYASYGFDSVGHEVKAVCDAVPASCSARTIRAGVQGFYRLPEVRPGMSPWFGLGVGWEWSSYSGSGLTETFGGPEIAILQAGADWRVGRNATLGPWLQAAIGWYSSIEQSAPAPYGSTSVDFDARIHAWLGLGVRGTVRL